MTEFNVDELRDSCWKCENCESSIDLEWIVGELIKECRGNEIFKNHFLSKNDSFDFDECSCCNHSYWFYDEDLKKLQNFIKEI